MSRGKIIAVIAGIAILLGGGGAYWYYHANNSPTANHTLNLSNVNTKHALQGAAAREKKNQENTASGIAKKNAREAAIESSFQERVHNDGMTKSQLKQKYKVTPEMTAHGRGAVKQGVEGALSYMNANNYDENAIAEKYFNDETYGLNDLMGSLRYGARPDYNSVKLKYYDGYVYQVSFNLNYQGKPFTKVDGYYISKTGQLQLKNVKLTNYGNQQASKAQY